MLDELPPLSTTKMASGVKNFFRKFFVKKKAPLACTMSLDPNHEHSDACYAEIAPLSIVEVFQSQGCESCPPAIPNIHKTVKANQNALLLTYNVTYWDGRSGWKDTHGNSSWDARQRAYVKKWARPGIFTPQVVVDGIADGVGRQEGEVNEIINRAIEARNTMAWAVGFEGIPQENALRIASDRTESEVFDLLLVTYDSSSETVKIGKGPNKGKKLVHQNLVKDVSKIEEWNGGIKQVALPEFGRDGFERVVVLQQGNGGAIVAAHKL